MKHFQNILYVSEPSVEQESALARAVSLAKNNQADLTVIDVIPESSAGIGLPPGGPISGDLQALAESESREVLEALVAPHRGGVSIQLEVMIGETFLETIRTVLRHGHDLVVKPAEDPDFIERLFGSDDMHLLRKCPVPVWMMKAGGKDNYERILAAVDFDPAAPETARQGLNQELLDPSGSLALSDLSALHLVHAWDAPAEMLLRSWSNDPNRAVFDYVESERSRHQKGMTSLREGLRACIGSEAYDYLSPQVHMIQGPARTVIPAMARELHADLVVMGTVARTGIPGMFIGNTAEAVLEQLHCSVLAVKPPGFVSPVTLT